MASTATADSVLGIPTVPKNPKPDPPKTSTSAGRQINFRAPAGLDERLTRVADALGLDVSNLVRMILQENLPSYELRAEQAKGRGS